MEAEAEKLDSSKTERSLIISLWEDDKVKFTSHFKRLYQASDEPVNRSIISKLLNQCCTLDSPECALALISGELGTVALVNEIDESGRTALHIAAESDAARCIALLLRKRARTDLRTKDDRALLAVEVSLSSTRLDVNWNPDDNSVEELVVLLSEKDLNAIRMLSEKTKEIAEVANAYAVQGRIIPLAALLIVALDKLAGSISDRQDASPCSKGKMSLYECVVREALALGREASPSSKLNGTPAKSENCEKRKLLLREIELLQLFDAPSNFTDNKVSSPLILACQAGDEAVIELLLKTGIDVNETDAEGNSSLHWTLKSSWSSTLQQIKIIHLLLRHGARTCQKNKLGMTAFHFASSNGNSQALQVLLVEDPDGINYKTEMKETPLFLAVKNDSVECTELLLRWGANTEVFNLRRQRPLDYATSQDIRFMLNRTNISLIVNHTSPMQRKYSTCIQGDEVISETCEALLSLTDEHRRFESFSPGTKAEICKFFESPGGCVRGAKCFYLHDDSMPRQTKVGMSPFINPAKKIKRKIFVGGLPPSMDSDSLSQFFEEQFGTVEDSVVVGTQKGSQAKSRGFGFVTFKDEKSASLAVEAHYVNIMGKQVEIKSIVPKCFLISDLQKFSLRADEQNSNGENESSPVESCHVNFKAGAKSEQISWVNRLLGGHTKTCPEEPLQTQNTSERQINWLRTFKKWFPSFLLDQSKNFNGEYPLSSLKGDFRATFSLELDHASLGYSKLSDFIKSFETTCSMKVVPIGKRGPATHLVLLPNTLALCQQQHSLIMSSLSSSSASNTDNKDGDSENYKNLQSLLSKSFENSSLLPLGYLSQNDESPYVNSKPLPFLKPDPLSPSLSSLKSVSVAGDNDDDLGRVKRHQDRQLVLEALARKRKSSSVFFLREFDFYNHYTASIMRGSCFGCSQMKMLWANFPCGHLLWCNDCKAEAIRAAGSLEHRCVVCNMQVKKIDLAARDGYLKPVFDVLLESEFPPLNPHHVYGALPEEISYNYVS